MYPFKHFIEIDKNTNTVSLCLIEENDTDDNHCYNLVYPESLVEKPDLRIYIAIDMTHALNTVAKNDTFKDITKRFKRTCKQVENLKI